MWVEEQGQCAVSDSILGANYCRTNAGCATERVKKTAVSLLIAFHRPILRDLCKASTDIDERGREIPKDQPQVEYSMISPTNN